METMGDDSCAFQTAGKFRWLIIGGAGEGARRSQRRRANAAVRREKVDRGGTPDPARPLSASRWVSPVPSGQVRASLSCHLRNVFV